MSTEKNKVNIGVASAKGFVTRKKQQEDVNALIAGVLAGKKTALARAITFIESTSAKHQEFADTVLKACLPHSGNSIRIGITGVPGAGKSTFIEALGNLLITKGHKVAVLAVDPTSSISHGSILGDKTRMGSLGMNANAFIRPSASGGSLGGVARKTRESIVLCEAAGLDVILVETVGVGQSDFAVHGMTDFFLLLKLAGAGDELQGIKRGIMEMADAILINKADGQNIQAAKEARIAFAKALHLYPQKENGWSPKVNLCSALQNTGIVEAWQVLEEYFTHVKENGSFQENRKSQHIFWLRQTIENRLKDDFYGDALVKAYFDSVVKKMHSGAISSFQAADELLKIYRSK
ncbi:MAG: methylmalonyl Co-A mutase-associated GTPase MeaB [Cytophagaceae bacterium]|nr:methylmalonyl Co-A mutase-associated GTPase MeaB [Cytophagaceae bacterium]|tara:strand:- start:3962 stop:5011 length:1050 start_codon:yes stop_codon:yes gene_type:complete